MAYDISSKFLKTVAFPHLIHLRVLVLFYPLILLFRKIRRSKVHVKITLPVVFPIVENVQETMRVHFNKERWVYIENVFNREYVNSLVKEWPKRFFLNPPRLIIKSYDTGFKWTIGNPKPAYLNLHPNLESMFEYVKSSVFTDYVQSLCNYSNKIVCGSFLVIRTYPGSFVAPHIDDPMPKEAGLCVNILFFIDGTGGTNSDGLSILEDNEFKKVVFEVQNLKNTCLVYDTRAPFYHGFKPVAFGKYRLAISASFHDASYQQGNRSM